MTTKAFESKLDFHNDGQLSLFFLGAGSAFQKSFYQTNLFVVKGDTHLLIDCGTLCPYVLEKEYSTKISSIKNLILTHPHADHIGGVEEIALTAYYISKQPVNIAIPPSFKKKLWNESLRGGIQFSERGKMTFNDYFSELPIKRLQKKPFEMYETNIGSINIKLFRTRHVTTRLDSFKNSQISYGLIFDDKVLFTGDTQFNPSQLKFLLERFNKVERIFHDCDVSGFSVGVHASYEQLKTFPDEIRAKMLLCHYNEKMLTVDAVKDGFEGFVQRGIYYNF
ncbi:MAG: MBL fold metallo-hydrolase [Treponema sp.]|nr:MBL fold metallo-hydrolase [Treponema sp.]